MRPDVRRRAHDLFRMPGEWLEIIGGAGGVVWAFGFIRLTIDPGHRAHAAYHDLLSLPGLVQFMLILVAVLGGFLQVASALVNEPRLRACASAAMAAFFLLIVVYLVWAVGFGPTIACYVIIISLNVVAAILLRISGYVRL